MAFNYSRIKNNIGLIILMIMDIFSFYLLFKLSEIIRMKFLPLFFKNLPYFTPNIGKYLWIFPIWFMVFLYEGLYTKRFAYWDEVKHIIKAIIITAIIIFSFLFISKKGADFSRILLTTLIIISTFLLPLIRLNVKKIIYSLGLMKRKIIIVGSGENAKKVLSAIKSEENLGYEVGGFVDDNPDKIKIENHKVHRGINQIERYIKSAHITDVIITKNDLTNQELSKLINSIQHKAQNTMYVPDFNGIAVAGTEIRYFFQEQTLAIEIKNNLSNPITYLTKRIMDYLLSIIIFIFMIIPLLLIAIAIKLTSEGPVIYSQNRIGKKGKTFRCHKFRTMYKDADKKLKELLEKDPTLKAEYQKYWKIKNDPRITSIGNFLRKTSLDELPQIFNVLKGEMSLVGPRPYLPKEWEFIEKESPIIHALPPGITGLWQVSGRSNTSYEYRISLDSWYVKNWNLWLDIVILFKTFSAVIKREGAC